MSADMYRLTTYSVQGNCSNPHAAQALGLHAQRPLPQAGAEQLLPLKPFQCLLLVPHTAFAAEQGRVWVDNIYFKLHRPGQRVLAPARWPVSFIAVGRRSMNYWFSDYGLFGGDPPPTELHVTGVTFQGSSPHSLHGISSAGFGTQTTVYVTGSCLTGSCPESCMISPA